MVEVLDMIARALNHTTYGINAQIETFTPAPGTAAPPKIVKVHTMLEEDTEEPQRVLDWPILFVSYQTPVEGSREFGTVIRDYDTFEIYIDLVIGSKDFAFTRRDSLNTIRCILKTLRDFMDPLNLADQSLNSVCLNYLNRVTWGPVTQDLQAGKVVGTVIPDYNVTDQAP